MNVILDYLNRRLSCFCDPDVRNVLKAFHLDDLNKDFLFLLIKHKGKSVYLAVVNSVIGKSAFSMLNCYPEYGMEISIQENPNIKELKQSDGVFTLATPTNHTDMDSMLSEIYSRFFIKNLSNFISKDFGSLVHDHIHKFHFAHISHADCQPRYCLFLYNRNKHIVLYFANLEVCTSFIRIMDYIDPFKDAPTFELYNKPNLVDGDDFLVISQKELFG